MGGAAKIGVPFWLISPIEKSKAGSLTGSTFQKGVQGRICGCDSPKGLGVDLRRTLTRRNCPKLSRGGSLMFNVGDRLRLSRGGYFGEVAEEVSDQVFTAHFPLKRDGMANPVKWQFHAEQITDAGLLYFQSNHGWLRSRQVLCWFLWERRNNPFQNHRSPCRDHCSEHFKR